MTIDQTQPLEITLSRETVLEQRRQGSAERERAADLDLYLRGGVRNRPTALSVAARMSARGEEQTIREMWAVKVLMKRWGISTRNIETQRRLVGSV